MPSICTRAHCVAMFRAVLVVLTCAFVAMLCVVTSAASSAQAGGSDCRTISYPLAGPSASFVPGVGMDGKPTGYRLEATGFGSFSSPGNPALPFRGITLALPPDADPETIRVEVCNGVYEESQCAEAVAPCPPMAANTSDGKLLDWGPDKNISNGKNLLVYGANALYPGSHVIAGIPGKMGDWNMLPVEFWPYRYNPITKSLVKLVKGDLVISFGTLARLQGTGQRPFTPYGVSDVVDNYDQAKGWYSANRLALDTLPGYVIITTSAIKTACWKLPFIATLRNGQGFNTQVIDETQWGGGTGDTAAENIRTWLKNNYVSMNIQYVLLIGDPNPTSGDVPMKMLWPRNNETTDTSMRDAPSDYYYADLTGDWDYDGDGCYGESDDDKVLGGVDRFIEVMVGRIPYYGNADNLNSIVQKIYDYETLPQGEWVNRALLPMKPSDDSTPGYHLGEAIKNDFLVPWGKTYTRIYEDRNYTDPPAEFSPCKEATVLAEWKKRAGMVFWWSHGWDWGAADVFSSPNCPKLDDTSPSVVFQVSCLNGKPESNNNLGYQLLNHGAVATVSASRVSWYWVGETSYNYSASNAGMSWQFAKRMIQDHKSLGDATYFMRTSVPLDFWMNHCVFNLYGDPATKLAEKSSALYARSITPATAANTGPVNITDLAGNGFQTGAVVTLRKRSQTAVTATSVNVVSTEKITCTFDLAGKVTGDWQVYVKNPDGQEVQMPGWFMVTLASVTGVTPSFGYNTGSTAITNLAGTGSTAGSTVKLTMAGQPDIPATGVTIVSSTKITCSFDLSGKAPGTRDVVVSSPSGQVAQLSGAFRVISVPEEGFESGDLSRLPWFTFGVNDWQTTTHQYHTGSRSLTFLGQSHPSYFEITLDREAGAVSFFKYAYTGYTASRLRFLIDGVEMAIWGNETWASVPDIFDVSAGTHTYRWELVKSGDFSNVTAYVDDIGFPPAPANITVSSLRPRRGVNSGVVGIDYLCGSGFVSGATARLRKTGQPDIPASSVAVVNPGKITCNFDLTGKSPGYWDLIVTNPDGQMDWAYNAFLVELPVEEDFETGNLSKLPWTTGGSAGWVVQSASKRSGSYAAASQSGANWLQVTVPGRTAGYVTYYKKQGQSGSVTTLKFFVDGVERSSLKSRVDWSSEPDTFYVAAGTHTYRWETDNQYCWLDDITFPPAVRIDNISPNIGSNNGNLTIKSLTGAGFKAGCGVRLTQKGQTDIVATGVTRSGDTLLVCTFNLKNAAVGKWDVVVSNTDGSYARMRQGFTVKYPAPTLASITPNVGWNSGTVNITGIVGTGFRSGATVKLVRGTHVIAGTSVVPASSIKITCAFNLSGAPPGTYDLVVTNADGQSAKLAGSFIVYGPPPILSSVSPGSGVNDASVKVSLFGQAFEKGASIKLTSGANTIVGTSVETVNAKEMNCLFRLNGATPGLWNVMLTNPDGQQSTLTNGFSVLSPAPTFGKISPTKARNTADVRVDIVGSGFEKGISIKLTRSGEPDIVATDVNVSDPTTVTCRLPVSGKTKGLWTLVLTNPNGFPLVVTNAFTIYANLTVAINQRSSQPDPCQGTVNFTVNFSESVSDFTATDVVIGGTALPTTVVIAAGSGRDYTVRVTGMTLHGTVTATIPAGAAHDAGGFPSQASSSADNSVTWNTKPRILYISPASGALTTGVWKTLSSAYDDYNGATDILKVYMLLSRSSSQMDAAYMMYDQSLNKLYLKNNANTSWGTGYAPGSDVTLSNSQVYLDVKNTTIARSGKNLVVKWRIQPRGAFPGTTLYAHQFIIDSGFLSSGWTLVGTYQASVPSANK